MSAAPAPTPKIVGGTPVPDGQFPFQTLVLAGPFLCGGSLIAPDWVLTAGHCVTDGGSIIAANRITAVVGRTLRSSSQGETFRVTEVFRHPQFAETALTVKNDAALLHLDGTSSVTPISIPASSDNRYEKPGTQLTATGWGTISESGPTSDRMRQVNVPVVSDAQCAKDYAVHHEKIDKPSSMCAGVAGKDTCSGDSGGPLFAVSPSGPVQVGITSWGDGCAEAGFPGVYAEANAPIIRSWLASHVPGL